MTTTIHDHFQKLADTDRHAWLGILAFYSVSDADVAHDLLRERLTKVGLDAFIPRPPSPDDVFRRTFGDGQRRTHKISETETERLLMREVVRADGKIVKRIVVELVNGEDEQLDYHEAVEIVFRKESPDFIEISMINGSTRAYQLAQTLHEEYERARNTVTGAAVREVVRQVFADSLATAVRPGGGLYFVPIEHAPKVEALVAASTHIPGCMVHSLPLIDQDEQRQMLRRAYEDESIGEIDKMVGEIADLTRKGEKITAKRFATFASRRRVLLEKTERYSDLLEENLDLTKHRIVLAEKELTELLKLVKA